MSPPQKALHNFYSAFEIGRQTDFYDLAHDLRLFNYALGGSVPGTHVPATPYHTNILAPQGYFAPEYSFIISDSKWDMVIRSVQPRRVDQHTLSPRYHSLTYGLKWTLCVDDKEYENATHIPPKAFYVRVFLPDQQEIEAMKAIIAPDECVTVWLKLTGQQVACGS